MNTLLNKELGRLSADTMADMVENRLREYFRQKSYKPGDALPKELELAEALGVSRNVIREALSRLRMLGMIESRKRRGMILASPDILNAFERVLDPNIISDESLIDLFQLRLVLEMGLPDVLFVNIKDQDIAELEKIVKYEVTDQSRIFRIRNEIEFHGKLYEIAGNSMLRRFQSMLLPVFDFVVKMEQKVTPSNTTHKDLVTLIKKGDKENFRQGMYDHLRPHFQRLELLKKIG